MQYLHVIMFYQKALYIYFTFINADNFLNRSYNIFVVIYIDTSHALPLTVK